MVQSNGYMARMAFGLDPATTLNPVVHLKYGPDKLATELHRQLGARLKQSRRSIKAALLYALGRQQQFVTDMHQQGYRILEKIDPCAPLLIVTGRPYNLYDDRLNLRLGQNLARIGLTALPMDFIDAGSVDLAEFPSMFWGLGAQILKTAKITAAKDNYFGLHLTNFGCGADSFIEHFYKSVMADKPYLILELDEHSAAAGVMTRIEAYKNVIENSMQKSQSETQPQMINEQR